MTDNRSAIAGTYPTTGIKQTVALMEGAPTVGTAYGTDGMTSTVITWAAELHEGDVVTIANNNEFTFAALDGIPAVEAPQNTESLPWGVITSTPTIPVNSPPNTAAGESLAKRLAGKYYRRAIVEFPYLNQIVKAELYQDGANATIIGVGTTLNGNIAATLREHKLCLTAAAGNGTGVIPLHYAAAGQAADLTNILVAVTGAIYWVTGA
jgi:hypothetical protein